MTPWRSCLRRRKTEAGFAMAALLVSVFIMSLMMAVALPVWHHAAKREREVELIFRGTQYARAIELWERQRPGSAPPDLQALIDQRFLRKKYLDPMTEDGEFRLVLQSEIGDVPAPDTTPSSGADRFVSQMPLGGQNRAGTPSLGTVRLAQEDDQVWQADGMRNGGVAGGIVGVVSKSNETSIAVYKGRSTYSEWMFVYPENGQIRTVPAQSGNVPTGLGEGAGQRTDVLSGEMPRRPGC